MISESLFRESFSAKNISKHSVDKVPASNEAKPRELDIWWFKIIIAKVISKVRPTM